MMKSISTAPPLRHLRSMQHENVLRKSIKELMQRTGELEKVTVVQSPTVFIIENGILNKVVVDRVIPEQKSPKDK